MKKSLQKYLALCLAMLIVVLLCGISVFAEVSPTATTIPSPYFPPYGNGDDPGSGWIWNPDKTTTVPSGSQSGTASGNTDGIDPANGSKDGSGNSKGNKSPNGNNADYNKDGNIQNYADDGSENKGNKSPNGNNADYNKDGNIQNYADDSSENNAVRTTPDGSVIYEDVRTDGTLNSPKTGDRTDALCLFSTAILLFAALLLIYKAKIRDTDARYVK